MTPKKVSEQLRVLELAAKRFYEVMNESYFYQDREVDREVREGLSIITFALLRLERRAENLPSDPHDFMVAAKNKCDEYFATLN